MFKNPTIDPHKISQCKGCQCLFKTITGEVYCSFCKHKSYLTSTPPNTIIKEKYCKDCLDSIEPSQRYCSQCRIQNERRLENEFMGNFKSKWND